MEKIPILYTTFNRIEYTKETLPVLIRNSSELGSVYIVDNGSTDGTVEYLKEFNHELIAKKIFNEENTGVAGAMNIFFESIRGSEFFAKVDNDTIVPENWLDDLYRVIYHTDDIDFIQAKHKFMMVGVKDWGDLLSKRASRKVFGHNLIHNRSVGGSGIIGRTSKVGKLDNSSGHLVGWTSFQDDNKCRSAFYDGVEIELLDLDDYNKLKIEDFKYLIQTGRIDPDTIPNVSIIIPFIREDRVKECIGAIKENAGLPDDKYEIIAELDKDRIGCPKMVKKLVDRSKYELVMFLADDTVPQKDFLIRATKGMNNFDGLWGLVGLNDGMQDGNDLATHWLANKKLLDYLDNREFFFTGYNHLFCDRELTDIAKSIGRYYWAEDSIIKHNHPSANKEYIDQDYLDVYSYEPARKDHKLYLSRKKARGVIKLGIGLPLTDNKVYTNFFASFVAMEKPDFTLLMPHAPGTIEAIRNNIVVQALRDQCTHLIMMDTDQVYPTDTITKLMSHRKDIVAVNVHRRYPPFDSILYRGTLGKYVHVPDEECFSGDLIEIDATGCGCVLYDTEIFLDIDPPWFEHYVHLDGRVVGEDIDFCSKIRTFGHKIYADTSIEVGHTSVMVINRDFYLVYKQLKGFEWNKEPRDSASLTP